MKLQTRTTLFLLTALLTASSFLSCSDSGSTSAVDTRTDQMIRTSFREYIPETTKIIISQRISSLMDADRIIVLEDGRIDGVGTHETLLKENAIYQEVWNTQKKKHWVTSTNPVCHHSGSVVEFSILNPIILSPM